MPKGNTTPRDVPPRRDFHVRLTEEAWEMMKCLMEETGERSKNRFLADLIEREHERTVAEEDEDDA